MPFTLHVDFDEIDGTAASRTKSVTIYMTTQITGPGGKVYDPARVDLTGGTADVPLPSPGDAGVSPADFGFVVRRGNGLGQTKSWNIPGQPTGTTVNLSQFTQTTPLPVTPEDWQLAKAEREAAEVAAGAAANERQAAQEARQGAEEAETGADAAATEAVKREQAGGTAGLTQAGKLYESRIPDRLSEVSLSAAYVRAVVLTGAGIDPAGSADSTAAIQAKINAAGTNASIFVPAGTFRLTARLTPLAGQRFFGVGPASQIRQDTWLEPAFDCLNTAGVTVEDLRIFSTVPRIHGTVGTRGDNATALFAGVWSNSDNVAVRNLTVAGFTCGVNLTNWNGTDLTTRRTTGSVVENLQVSNVDFGILGKGQENYSIAGVRGSYTRLTNSPNPSHLLYFSSDNALSCRGGVISDCLAWDSPDSYAYQFKNVESTAMRSLVARNCAGVCSMFTCIDVTVDGMVSVGDVSDTNGSLYMANATNARVSIRGLNITRTTSIRAVRVDGVDCFVGGKVSTTHTTISSDVDVIVFGTRNTVEFEVVNTDTAGGWRAIALFAGSGHRAIRPRVTGCLNGVRVEAGVAGCMVDYDPVAITPGTLAAGNFRSVNVQEPTTVLTRAPRVLSTSGDGGIVQPEASTYAHNEHTTTGTANMTVANPRPDARTKGLDLRISIVNGGTGAMGTISWQTDYALRSAVTAPAAGARISLLFQWDGTKWQEVGRST